MDEVQTFKKICSTLGYDTGLIESVEKAHSPVQRHIFSEAQRQIKDLKALYFSGDVPVAYFKLLSDFDEEKIKELHRRVWNQNRVPLLYVVTPGELRIYNCFEKPAKPEDQEQLDDQNRLIKQFNIAAGVLEKLNEFSKSQIDSGAFWKSETGQRFRSDRRADQRLLEELRVTRKKLHDQGLDYPIIHNLLGRSIFILYLEDRGAIKDDYYTRFLGDATTYFDVIKDKDAAYNLFKELGKRFNGDLFPVTEKERTTVKSSHLRYISKFFLGTHMLTGQTVLWRPYDFSVIPIEFVSAIYEEFLHTEGGKGHTSKKGAYYTPHPLVEFILNEVLPWPSDEDHRYDLRILDPACGSGIFLVEAFRRLVARWKFSHNKMSIPRHNLTHILTNHIYGIDINPDAVKVAAFSLYLALLDYLEPRTIWEEFKFPYLIYRSDDPKSDVGNLFPLDLFTENAPFERSDYDIVVGNPPWKRDGLPENISVYLHKLGFAQEMAQAFLWRARDFSSNGRIALLAASKILFNVEPKDRNFRGEFFGENYVETIINFSALRKTRGKRGRQLFVSAVGPASVFFYHTKAPEQQRPTILYCTPKPTRADNALPGITIDASEFKFLPREKCKTSDKIWKVAMWGTQRDLEVVERFLNTKGIGDYIDEREDWYQGRGFNTPGAKEYKDEDIANMPLMSTTSVKRYWLNRNRLEIVGEKWFRRIGAKDTYYAPHILIKEGQHNKRFCAAFADFDCAFKYAVFGISANTDEMLLKALTAYLNSSFASYLMFLTASTWGIERERVYPIEVLSLPGIPFQMSEDSVRELAYKVDIIGELISVGIPEADKRILKIEAEIDQIIYANLDLSESERFLIEDVLQYSLDFFQEGEKSQACNVVDTDDLVAYAKTFCDTVNSLLQFGESRASATVYDGKVPLRLVSIHIGGVKDEGSITKLTSTAKLKKALENLEKQTLTEYSESIYVRRNVKIYDGDTIHITKPDEKRFWSRSMALRDADETLAERLNVEVNNAK